MTSFFPEKKEELFRGQGTADKMKDLDLNGFNENSVVDIARVIQLAIQHYQSNIDKSEIEKSAEPTCQYAMRQAIRLGRGHYPPETIQRMISLERSVYNPATTLMC